MEKHAQEDGFLGECDCGAFFGQGVEFIGSDTAALEAVLDGAAVAFRYAGQDGVG